MDILERIDEIRANSVTPEEFEKAWGMSVEEYRQKIRAFSKDQDAELAKKKRQPKRVAFVSRPAARPRKVGCGRANSGMKYALMKTLKKRLGMTVLKDMAELKRKRMGYIDVSGIDLTMMEQLGIDVSANVLRKDSGVGRIGGAGGKANRRKGGKGTKGKCF